MSQSRINLSRLNAYARPQYGDSSLTSSDGSEKQKKMNPSASLPVLERPMTPTSFKVIPMDNLLMSQDVGTPLGRHARAKNVAGVQSRFKFPGVQSTKNVNNKL